MGYYIGQFYIDKRDIFLIISGVIVVYAIYFGYPIPYFNPQHLLFFLFLLFIAKGLILPTHDSVVFVVFLLALFMTLFFPLFQSLIFLVLSFLFLRLAKVI